MLPVLSLSYSSIMTFYKDVQELSCYMQILGTGMSTKMWEVTVEHARTCVLDKRIYLYCTPGSQQKTGVVFNVVGQVMGLLSECQYVHIDKLSETEKVHFSYNSKIILICVLPNTLILSVISGLL